MPPNSPATKMPGTVDSNFGVRMGMSTPRRSLPNTSVMALTGQAVLHAPWPMQSPGLTRTARPSTMPRTVWCACSGQALTHELQPIQVAGSIIG